MCDELRKNREGCDGGGGGSAESLGAQVGRFDKSLNYGNRAAEPAVAQTAVGQPLPLAQRIRMLGRESEYEATMNAQRLEDLRRLNALATQHPDVVEMLDLCSRLGLLHR